LPLRALCSLLRATRFRPLSVLPSFLFSLPQHYYYFVTEFDLVPRKVGAPLSMCPHQVAHTLPLLLSMTYRKWLLWKTSSKT
jgi:hypothetical protein